MLIASTFLYVVDSENKSDVEYQKSKFKELTRNKSKIKIL